MIKTETTVRVRYYETDQMGITHHANYIKYFEVGRSEFMRAIGFPYSKMEEEGCMSPIMSIQIRYVRPTRYDDTLTIKTEVRELPTPTNYAMFYQNIYNEKGKLVAGGSVKLGFINAKTRKRELAPSQLIEAFKQP